MTDDDLIRKLFRESRGVHLHIAHHLIGHFRSQKESGDLDKIVRLRNLMMRALKGEWQEVAKEFYGSDLTSYNKPGGCI